jgi:hypothetical protein
MIQTKIEEIKIYQLNFNKVSANDLKVGMIVEIKNLLYWGDAWNNYDGFGEITAIYHKTNTIDVSFINCFNFYSKCGVNVSDIIRMTDITPYKITKDLREYNKHK